MLQTNRANFIQKLWMQNSSTYIAELVSKLTNRANFIQKVWMQNSSTYIAELVSKLQQVNYILQTLLSIQSASWNCWQKYRISVKCQR